MQSSGFAIYMFPLPLCGGHIGSGVVGGSVVGIVSQIQSYVYILSDHHTLISHSGKKYRPAAQPISIGTQLVH
jgi:hypothetical protein